MVTKDVRVSSEVSIGGDFCVVVTSGQAFYAMKTRVLAQWHPVYLQWVPTYGLYLAVSHHD